MDDPLAQLMAMGFSQELSQLALDSTQYQGVEVAIGWITEQVDGPISSPASALPLPSTGVALTAAAALVAQVPGAMKYKMVFVVNTSLHMSVGKTAAQVGHAALGLFRRHQRAKQPQFDAWEHHGETKIVLRGTDTRHLETLDQRAKATGGLVSLLIHDAGHTEVEAGSTTVLGIFGEVAQVDSVTGTLSLLA